MEKAVCLKETYLNFPRILPATTLRNYGDRTDSDDWALDHLSSLELRFQKRMTCEKSGIQVNIRSIRGQQSDKEGANSLRQVKMSETGSHGSHRAPIQNRRKEAGINGSDFNSGGWIEAQSEGETSNNL
ncbi:unnamed protein product [Caenorhabditis nigoni]